MAAISHTHFILFFHCLCYPCSSITFLFVVSFSFLFFIPLLPITSLLGFQSFTMLQKDPCHQINQGHLTILKCFEVAILTFPLLQLNSVNSWQLSNTLIHFQFYFQSSHSFLTRFHEVLKSLYFFTLLKVF